MPIIPGCLPDADLVATQVLHRLIHALMSALRSSPEKPAPH